MPLAFKELGMPRHGCDSCIYDISANMTKISVVRWNGRMFLNLPLQQIILTYEYD